MDKKLGRIEQVDLRSIWTSESRDFTPWLAQEENLAELGATLGIDLELEAQEKEVGPFSADLLCKNTADESWVVIENQIEKTDHKHLGQLLTYAAGLKAVTIVWIAAEFNEEHRAALDWLNQMTVESVRFFGLEIELWRIGDSPAAPRFNVISQPNDWQNNVRDVAIASERSRPSEILRMKYWTAFRSFLQENKSKLRPQKPGTNHWYNFGIGTSLAHLSALLIAKDDNIGIELCINSDNAKFIYAELFKQKSEIEEKIGAELEWKELPDKKTSRILLYKSVQTDNENTWPEQFAWLQRTLEKFDQTFRPIFAARATEFRGI